MRAITGGAVTSCALMVLAPRSKRAMSCGLLLLSLLLAGIASAQAPAGSLPAPESRSSTDDPRAAVDETRLYYESGRYRECVAAARAFLAANPAARGRSYDRLRSQAHTYLAACLLAEGDREQAEQQFRQAVLESPQMPPPDPVAFPQAVIDVFVAVRGRLMAALRRQQEEDLARSRREAERTREQIELEQRRQRELWRLAQQETLVRTNERWMASLPFGVGQFNNGDRTLGWAFLAGEVALVATAVTATSIELGLHTQARGGRSNLDADQLTTAVGRARTVGKVAWLGTLLSMIAGAVEANLSFRSELPLGSRPRALPQWLLQSPDSSARARGAVELGVLPEGGLSISGRF